VINGLSGETAVNGTTINGVMPAVRLSDEEVANGAYLAFVMANPKWRLSTQGEVR